MIATIPRHYLAQVIAFSFLLVGTGIASIVVVPPQLLPGDKYRLAFLTDGTITATSSDIGVYNQFVTSEAAAVSVLNSLNTTWKAIVSTATVDARDNTGTNPTVDLSGVQIFSLGGFRIAGSNSTFWDGSNPPINRTPLGNEINGVTSWTGTNGSGQAAYPIGDDTQVAYGEVGAQLGPGGWTFASTASSSGARRLYAISGELVVIPEPSLPLLTIIGILGVALRRNKRS